MKKNKSTLISVVGPTAIGKTALSIELAKHFNAPIISCDSRQFFKEMTIGTAVPSVTELESAKHYFIQNKSIFDNFNVGAFEKEAIELLEKLFSKHDIVIMVGGSGLYVNAVTKGLDDFPKTDRKHRIELNNLLETEGLISIQKLLKEKDPAYFEKVDIQNPHRLIRALEVCLSSGKPYSSFLNKKKNHRTFTSLQVGLEADRNILYKRINKRVDIMMQEGLLKEVENLLPHRHLNALQTVGYREFFDYFDGKISLEEAVELVKRNTRRFAKRQGTWFRKDKDIMWFNFEDSNHKIIKSLNQIIAS